MDNAIGNVLMPVLLAVTGMAPVTYMVAFALIGAATLATGLVRTKGTPDE